MEYISSLIQELNIEAVFLSLSRIVIILIAALILGRFIRLALIRLENRLVLKSKKEGLPPTETEKRAETLVKLLRQGLFIFIWLIVLLIVLRELDFDIAPILAGAGVLGLAVGFGAQNLIRDVISGFFIIMENQVRIGDVAIINGTGGLVEELNFRTIVLRDLQGTVHVFPNGTINTLSNMTSHWSAYVFDLAVAYKEDTDKVVEIIEQVGQDMHDDQYFGPLLQEKIEIFGVDRFDDSGVIIRGRIKTKPIRQWEVGRQFLRRIKKAFDREGIEIPFPHRSIYFGSASKPFDVQMIEKMQNRTSVPDNTES